MTYRIHVEESGISGALVVENPGLAEAITGALRLAFPDSVTVLISGEAALPRPTKSGAPNYKVDSFGVNH